MLSFCEGTPALFELYLKASYDQIQCTAQLIKTTDHQKTIKHHAQKAHRNILEYLLVSTHFVSSTVTESSVAPSLELQTRRTC